LFFLFSGKGVIVVFLHLKKVVFASLFIVSFVSFLHLFIILFDFFSYYYGT